MPVDFTGNPPAFVDMGDGGAHDPQLRVTAPDNGCVWNDFPVALGYGTALSCGTQQIFTSDQVAPFVTTAGGGTSGPSTAEWPDAAVVNYLTGLLCGLTLQARIQFTANSLGTSVGSFGIFERGDGSCGGKPGPILGAYDSGWFDISCQDCTLAPDYLALTPGFSNFSPISGSVEIVNGHLDLQWVAGVPLTTHAPNNPRQLIWRPPCYEMTDSMTDFPTGLWYSLPTNSCGEYFETYTNVRDNINAAGLGFVATILGGHAFDIAQPDPACDLVAYAAEDWRACPMAGAICSGTVGSAPGGGITV